jgi:hypothetical protein
MGFLTFTHGWPVEVFFAVSETQTDATDMAFETFAAARFHIESPQPTTG